MVPRAGVEPARPFERGILSPLRLPLYRPSITYKYTPKSLLLLGL